MNVARKKPTRKPRTLADFDLDQEALAHIVGNAHIRMQDLGPYFPKTARGMTFYFHFVAGLREYLVNRFLHRWTMKTVHGLEVVECAEKGLRLGYFRADLVEGGGDLRSVRPRGTASANAAQRNEQLCLPLGPTYLGETLAYADDSDFETWFVAVCNRRSGYYLEVALPTSCEDGQFATWEQRIAVGEIPLDSEPTLAKEPSATVAKPKVTRKPGNAGRAKVGHGL